MLLTLADPQRLAMIEASGAHNVEIFTALTHTLTRHGVDVRRARALDIGCGAEAPMTLLLKGAGAQVTGVDYYLGHRWGLGFKPSRYAAYLREAGLARTARKAIGELVYDRVYYRTLRRHSGLRIDEDGLDLRQMHATQLDFADATFDIVHSNATWEHILDVPAANAELARVLKPGGIAYIEVHLFPSISGGHDLPYIVPGKTELGGVQPWGHLRNPQWHPPALGGGSEFVPLNRWTERQYVAAFEATAGLSIADWITEFTEGHSHLTDDIRKELGHYTERDLTTRSIIAVLKRS